MNQWHKSGLKTVFSNGCFDIVHLGHVDYLEKAAALGDKLIIGINTDKSIQQLKGPERPIIHEDSRFRLMAALGIVSLVVPFSDETPIRLIETLTPSVLVKGDDYTVDTIVGANHVINNGGSVQTIPLVEGFSTSSIIRKIIDIHN